MLVKYVENENEAYWVLLRDIAGPNNPNQKTLTVHIPRENRMSDINWDEQIDLIKKITYLKLGAVNE